MASAGTSEDGFPQFARLPAELRVAVWETAALDEVCFVAMGAPLNNHLHPKGRTNAIRFFAHLEPRRKRLAHHLLSTCWESHSVVRSLIGRGQLVRLPALRPASRRILLDEALQSYLLVNPSTDILLVECDSLSRVNLGSMLRSSQVWQDMCTSGLRRVAGSVIKTSPFGKRAAEVDRLRKSWFYRIRHKIPAAEEIFLFVEGNIGSNFHDPLRSKLMVCNRNQPTYISDFSVVEDHRLDAFAQAEEISCRVHPCLFRVASRKHRDRIDSMNPYS